MVKRMLIDATHKEETRVAVVSNNRLEEFDFENTIRKSYKGNVYLAKVTRVEPSLQAAFVDYGGNRHGFLPFTEIHPDYYRIPVADREALLARKQQIAEQAAAEEEARERSASENTDTDGQDPTDLEEAEEDHEEGHEEEEFDAEEDGGDTSSDDENGDEPDSTFTEESSDEPETPDFSDELAGPAPAPSVETVGGEDVEPSEKRKSEYLAILKEYKIQEVIKRGQVMLVQVTKEERGTKGAALTSYVSLPGRYCVLMPNSPHGGGVSRKVANVKDRQKLKKVLTDLNLPRGMSVIIRTAGVARTKVDIKRDYEYLMREWSNLRELTLRSTAPTLVYEEGDLIKRSIRDLYSGDIDEIHVAGQEGFEATRDFIKMLIPSHAKRVQPYEEGDIPLFFRYQVESQIAEIHSPMVQLRSGGYIIINPTEALVSIDVNSGRATKERHIEETALKTNLEAAEEIARQLRLRDLGGLIVVDFIDMEERRNNKAVERRLKDAMDQDRARVQIGRISAFGLLEMSRQRLRPSLLETHFEVCPNCKGIGYVRTLETAAIRMLRIIEEEAIRKRSSELFIEVPDRIALFILNQKREMLASIEQRYELRVNLKSNDALAISDYVLERIDAKSGARVKEDQRAPEEDVKLTRQQDRDRMPRDRGEGDEGEGRPRGDRHERGGRRRGGRDRDRGRNRNRGRDRFRERESGENSVPENGIEPADVAVSDEPKNPENNGRQERGDGPHGRRRRRGRRGGRNRNRRDRGPRDDRGADRGSSAFDDGTGPQPYVQERSPAPAAMESRSFRAASAAESSPRPESAGDGASDESGPKRRGWWSRFKEKG